MTLLELTKLNGIKEINKKERKNNSKPMLLKKMLLRWGQL